MAKEKPRWVYRFDNYKRAFILLREAVTAARQREMSLLEKEGIIQRFEYSWDLAWKLLKDYLENAGIVLDTVTPNAVLKAAYEAGIITDGDTWMDALDARNETSHTYNVEIFRRVLDAIETRYTALLGTLYEAFLKREKTENSNA